MAFCTNCGHQLADDAKFCFECGAKIDSTKEQTSEQRKTVYDGQLHKCPNCGERLDSFVTICPACGYELRGTKTTSVVNDLVKRLERIKNPEQKVDLIRNFYIPNTKEDIYEFFVLALSNINTDSYAAEAWYSKLEQAYQKAKLSFGNTPEFQYLSQLYNKAAKQQRVKSVTNSIKKSRFLQCILLGAVGAVIMIIGFFGGSMSEDPNSPFYMIAMIGFFPIMGAAIYAMVGARSNSEESYDDDDEEDDEDDEDDDFESEISEE